MSSRSRHCCIARSPWPALGDLGAVLSDFLTLGGIWGTALMVYLNRQSARRLLARLRADELERAQAERRLIASRLIATEAQIDPGSVLRQLGEVRDLFAEESRRPTSASTA